MGWLTGTFAAPVAKVANAAPLLVSAYTTGRAAFPDSKYSTYAREGYMGNALVYACIREIATSVSEPRLGVRGRDRQYTFDDPILTLLGEHGGLKPNPFMDRNEFWGTVMMHLGIAGNAYGLIVRSQSKKAVELWLMRPDRVRVVPSSQTFISHYEYDTGAGDPAVIPREDVIHWKQPHPLDDYYGMPPLMPVSGRVDIDNFMQDFVKTAFEKRGMLAGMLSIKGKVTPEARQEIKARFRSDYGGPSGWHELMVIDQDATFTPMTANMGANGLVMPELNLISETRICMCFGVPPELIGALAGMQNSSYAQKDAARESFWEETLAPLFKSLEGPLNQRLVPSFYPNSAAAPLLSFDMGDVKAMQEDEDQLHARVRQDVAGGLLTIEEARQRTGYPTLPSTGTLLIPANNTPILASDVRAGRANEVLNPVPPQIEAPEVVE